MEQVNILFFILSTFFGINDSKIAAEKTTVTINPQSKTITIVQENLFAIVTNEAQNNALVMDFDSILKKTSNNLAWSNEMEKYTNTSCEFYETDRNLLNAKIIFNYENPKDLKSLGVYFTEEKKYAINHIPNDNLSTKDGMLNGNYWYFETDKPFAFSFSPFKEIPEAYKKFKKSLYPIWINIKK